MAYPHEVKKIAYALDPECWISYSGAPLAHKRAMDARRSESLRKAEAQYEQERGQREIPIDIPSELEPEEVRELLLELVDHLGLRVFRRGGLLYLEPKES